MSEKKNGPDAKAGLNRMLEQLEVSGTAVILDKEGNVKRHLRLTRIKPLQEGKENAD